MPNKIQIGKKFVGNDLPVFIVAEAGVNHNGDLKTALKLVDAAAEAGADAVKFQTFKADQVVTASGKMAEYQKNNSGKIESQLAMLKKLELPDDFYPALIRRCREKKIIFLSTPHGGFNSVDFLSRFKVPAFKFGSGDLTNLPLLQHAAKLRRPMILGTGMATLNEARAAIEVIKQAGNKQIIALHCTTSYPCPLENVNLKAMVTMAENLKVLVGYSDHALGIQASIMSATLGACLIEKHFTLDRNLPGPDHKASIEAAEFKKMAQAIRNVEKIMGSGHKQPTAEELELRKIGRKSLVALKDIASGEKFTKENVGIKRPGTGLAPEEYWRALSKKAGRQITADSLIKLKDIK